MKGIQDFTNFLFIIGEKGLLTEDNAIKQARFVKQSATDNITADITMLIYGYDDDPRDLRQIPEVVRYIGQFAFVLHEIGLPPNFVKRLTPESLRWKALENN